MKKHLKTSATKECDNPNKRIAIVVPARQHKSTGLRPTWSERRFHWNEVEASAAKCRETYHTVYCKSKSTPLSESKTHYYPRIVPNLPRITSNIRELSQQLKRCSAPIGRAKSILYLVEIRTYRLAYDRFSEPSCAQDGYLDNR